MSNQSRGEHRQSSPAEISLREPDAVVPFLLGAAVGGVAGAVVGTIFSGHAAHLVGTLLDVADRRVIGRDRNRPKFEYLQQ